MSTFKLTKIKSNRNDLARRDLPSSSFEMEENQNPVVGCELE